MNRNCVINKRHVGSVIFAFVVFFSHGITAQSSSSSTYFLPVGEQASGSSCTSSKFKLDASFGSGVVPQHSTSENFKLLGGFNAAIEAPTIGMPWLTGVLPLYGPILGSIVPFTIHGTELDLGTVTSITIGGRSAPVMGRKKDLVQVQLPAQPAPGWQPVTATIPNIGSSTLPEGIGILPMIEKAWAIEVNQPFRITYRGTQGDIIYIAVAGAKYPFPAPIPPYNFGLELNFGALLGFVGPIQVTNPSGEFHLDIPGIPFIRPIFVQMLGLPIGNTGYQPGCFTNTISL